VKLKPEYYKGQKIIFERDKDFVMAMSGEINKYDGKPKYYVPGKNKKEALYNIKKRM